MPGMRLFAAIVLIAIGSPGALRGHEAHVEAARESMAPQARRPDATIVVVRDTNGRCSNYLNGAEVNPTRLYERNRILLEHIIMDVGGAGNLSHENLPVIRVEAPADATWTCIVPALRSVERAGIPLVALQPVGSATQPQRIARFMLRPVGRYPSPSFIVDVGADGRALWNGAAMDRAAVAQRIRAGRPQPLLWHDLVLIPAAETRLSTLYELLSVAGDAGIDITLAGCRANLRGTGDLGC